MYPQLQASPNGKRRVRRYDRARAALPSPAGRIGDGSTRAPLELVADLRALIRAGLIEPLVDGRTVRYALVDANNDQPTPQGR